MIGAFARMIGARERILQVEQTEEKEYHVRVHGAQGPSEAQHGDAPPEQFVERISQEGGDVIVAPIIEALRDILGRRRSEARAKIVPGPSENR